MTPDDTIADAHIGPMWARHFPRIADDVVSKTLILTLIYLIEDKAGTSASDGDWSARVSQELRRYGIPSEQFWEIYNSASK